MSGLLFRLPPHRARKCIFDRPSITESVAYQGATNPQLLAPLCDIERQPIKGNVDIIAPIVCLLLVVCPFAVIGGVGAVVINTIDGMIRAWARPHVFIERFKGFAPARAYGNTSASVVWVARSFLVVAAGTDSLPAIVFWRSLHAVSAARTSATGGTAISKSAAENYLLSSAITATQPSLSLIHI